jgi:hypothetical protein
MAKMLASQILSLVIRPSLSKINLWSPSAEELVLGTAIVESGLTYLRQWGDGPALGLRQVEPSTQNDLYTNFLNYRPELGSQLMELRAPNLSMDENLATNLMYGAAVCRLCYYRKPDALPKCMKGEGYLFPSRDGTPLDGTYLRERVLSVRRLACHAMNGRHGMNYATPLPPIISMHKAVTSNG